MRRDAGEADRQSYQWIQERSLIKIVQLEALETPNGPSRLRARRSLEARYLWRVKPRRVEKETEMIEWFDDLSLGMRFKSKEVQITRDDIKRFATEFEPQPFHLDEAAAEHSVFKELAASGWHTAAIAMRLAVDQAVRPASPCRSASTICVGWLRSGPAISCTLRERSLA